MSYIKTSWVARVGTALNRFLKTNESAGSVELTNDPTGVTTAGTPFTVANMNKIEQGIYDAHELIDNHKLNDGTDHSFIDQDVTKESSPEFKSIKLNGLLLFMAPSSTILSSFASPNTRPFGLTFDGTNLISCDVDSDRIYIHDGISSTILSSFASPSTIPSGLTFDGTNLISCDSDLHMIYVHDGVSSTILSSFASPSSNPSGLTFDGTNLISCDSDLRMIYKHKSVLAQYI